MPKSISPPSPSWTPCLPASTYAPAPLPPRYGGMNNQLGEGSLRGGTQQAQLAQQQQAFHDLLEVKAALDRRSEGVVPNGAAKPAPTASPAKATEVDALRAAAARHADERQGQAERVAALASRHNFKQETDDEFKENLFRHGLAPA